MNKINKQLLKIIEDYKRDSMWFFDNYDKFKRYYRNKYVVVKNEKILFSAKNIRELKRKAKMKNVDLTTAYINKVPKKDITIIF